MTTGQNANNPLSEKEARHRQIRLHRLRMAFLAWTVSLFITGIAWALGLLDVHYIELGAMVLIVLSAQLFFQVAVRTGWSLKFRDPSLTLPHILVATLIALWVISNAGAARTILLMLFILAALFGAFQLRQREFMIVALIAVAGHTGIVLRDIFLKPDGVATQLVVLELAVFATLMVWLAWFGSYISRLRRTLSGRNRELREVSARLQHMAEHDELTGLPNRRRLIARLEDAAAQSTEGGPRFSVALLDLDHFKQVNDTHGHQAGDEVLTEFSRRSESVLRGADSLLRVDETVADIGRFGGEEFLAILPNTDLAGARLAAERLREAIAERPFRTCDGPVECTVSIGVTEHQPDEGVHRTIARADEALYAAKTDGRNRVKSA